MNTSFSKLEKRSDEMQALQIMQVAAPIMQKVCRTLVELAKRRLDLDVNQIVMCNEEVGSVISKVLLSFESGAQPCSSRRPVVGDIVRHRDASRRCECRGGFLLERGEVAEVTEAYADGDFWLRDPRRSIVPC